MVELVDAQGWGPCTSNSVWVRVSFLAPVRNYRFDTMYQAFFYTFIWVRFSYVLDINNKDLSNNDIFYNECVLVVVLFAKRFERVVSIIKRYAKWFQIIKRYTRWFHTIKRLYKFIVNTKKIWYNKSKEVAIYVWEFENNKWMQKNT